MNLSWWLAIVPEIALIILLFVVLTYHRFIAPDEHRRVGLFTAWGGVITLLITIGLAIAGEPSGSSSLGNSLIWGGMIRHDMVTLVFRVMFQSALVLVSLFSLDTKELQKSEYFALLIAATIGFDLMAASADLIMLYVALEMASISSYLLAGFLTKKDRSSEAGMKYFVYGAFATGIMLYGMSLLYGIGVSLGLPLPTNLYFFGGVVANAFEGIPPNVQAAFASNGVQGLLLLASVMIIVGFGFKISAVPFHFWAPDVYEGSPTAFTAFVSTASKAAGFAVLIRLFLAGMVGLPNAGTEWWAMLVAMCIVTMTLGNFLAIFQTNIKRLLAYSSVAQAGYALIGLITLTSDGSGATMFYLLMYVFTNAAAFGVIILLSNITNSDEVEDLSGLSRRSPYLALVMMLALLSLGGIPPTAGFLGKFFLFRAAVDAGYWWLALIGILNAFIALYYYLNLIKYMYLYRSDEEDIAIPVSRGAQVGLVLSSAAIIFLGVYAGPAFEWTTEAAKAFFTG